MAKNLWRLQEIEVIDCQNLEMIVGSDLEKPATTSRSKEIIAEDDLDEKVIFPSLEKLKVRTCNRLEYLFSFSMVKSLVRLQHLEINSCNSMKGILDTAGLRRDEAKLIEMVFPKLLYMELTYLPKLTSFATGIQSIEFPSLFHLELCSCHNLRRFIPTSLSEDIICSETQPLFDEKVGLPCLEILTIAWMSNLRKIWHHRLDLDSFSKLKNLEIKNCEMISHIFPANIIMGSRLESLEVFDCNSLEEIVEETSSICNNFMVNEEVLRRFVFPRLTSLGLWYLPKLKRFFLGKHISEWPVLESLKVVGCHKVDTLFASSEYMSRESQQPLFLLDQKVAFPNLMTLDVSLCDRLRSLLTLSTAQSLVRLATMVITDCKNIEKIIQVHAGEEVEEDCVVFRQLKILVLDCLESLTSFCLENYTLEFPSLERVYVRHCLNMKTFSQGILHTPTLHKVQLTYNDDEGFWEGNLNSTLQKVFDEMVGFRNIWHLKLSEIPTLKELWHSQALPVSSFCSLRELVVDHCTFMSTAIPANLLRFLNNLKSLEVRNCDSLEEVFHLEELNSDEHFGPLFPKLEELKLIELPKLKRFCNFTGNIIELPSLLHLKIKYCTIMETFISNSTPVPKEPQEVTSEENFLVADIQTLFDEKVIFPRLDKLIVKYCKYLKYLFSFSMGNSLVQLQHLEIRSCESMKGVVDTSRLGRDEQKLIEFPSLLHLELYSCCNLRRFIPMSSPEEIIHTETQPLFDEKVGLPSLEILKIEWMSNLRKIWHHQLASDSFSKLKNLEIKNCEMIINIFPANIIMGNRLASLVCLEVFDCYSIEEIIEETSSNCNNFILRRFVFPLLTSLELWYLPNLKSFFLGKHISECPVLESLKVVGCHKVETLFASSEYLSHESQQPLFLLDQKVAFPHLMNLEVSLCDRLRSLVTLSTAENLVRLATMTITDCKIIETIIQVQSGEETGEDRVVFSQMENLALECLESLTSFCQGNYTLEFPSLERVYVKQCLNMKIFSQGVLHSPKLHKMQLTYNDDEGFWEGNLNSTLQKVFDEMAGFHNILHLKLSQLPYLKEIWHGQTLPVSQFSNLRDLVVDDCMIMSSAIPAKLLRFLNNLKSLEVRNCDSLEEVFHLEELNADEHFGPLFPQLEELKLIDLSKLKRFCNFTGNIIELPSLLHLMIKDCPIMETFISNSTPVPKEPQEVTSEENFLVADIQPLFDEKVIFPRLDKLIVEYCKYLKYMFSFSMGNSLVQLQHLEIRSCESMKGVVDTTRLGRDEQKLIEFPSLLHLELYSCRNLRRFIPLSSPEEIIHTETQPLFDEKVGLPSLEILKIEWMSNLRKIWHHQLASDSFSKLKNLEIKHCEMISNIFPANIIMGNRLASLVCLEVFDCYSIEEIIEETSSNCNNFLLRRFVFPLLTSLELWYLPNLKSFFLGKHISECPVLESLKVVGCHKVETLFASSEYLSHESQQPLFLLDQKVAYPHLMNLEVSLCDRLRSLVTLSTAENLVRLATMTITDCKIIETIIQVQAGEETGEDRVVFSQMENLALECLESLTSFCQGNYTLEFPSLERVYVKQCLNMKIFSQGVLHSPKLHKVQLTYNDDEGFWEGNLNSTLQKVFDEMAGFHNILHLKFSQFPYLKEIWHGQALPVSLFSNLRDLVVDDCTIMSSAIPARLLRFLNNLKSLEVRNCDSLEEVFHLEELNADEHFRPLFPKLEELKLIDLSKLKRFCNFTGNIIKLPSLLHLIIENCSIMETFISNNTPVPKEPQEIASEENFLVADIQPLFDEKVSFANLEELKLFRLPMLSQLWKENSQPSKVFQNLKTLVVSDCNKLEKLVPSSVSFRNLMTLEVSKCEGLINMVAYSTAASLEKLERMKIRDCKMIEEIIQKVGEEVLKDPIVFNKLQYLKLDRLPSLLSFCLENYTLEFPSLKRVIMSKCPKMKKISQRFLHSRFAKSGTDRRRR